MGHEGVEWILAVEDHFGITIPEADAEKMATVGGLHDFVFREVCKREGFRLSPRLHVWMWGARRGV